MSKEQIELLDEARKSLSAAKLLLDGGYTGYAASLEQAQEQIIRADKFIDMAENLIKHIL